MDAQELALMPRQARTNLDVLLVFNILRTHNCFGPHLDRGLADLHLTGSQLNALLLLQGADPGGLPLSEIGRNLIVSKANITGLMDRMEQRGLVYRDCASDRRVTVAKLTPKGRLLAKSVFPGAHRLFAEMVDCLTEPEKKDLISILTKLRKNLRKKWEARPQVLPQDGGKR